MEVELLLHGVPDGQKYYGIEVEHTNMGLFYDNSTESIKYVVETKKNDGKAYAYYSYLRYKGIVEAGGRTGSYFGLTLRIDKYYQDAMHIFHLLDMLFKRYIVGTLLNPMGDGYKYIVTSFSSKSTEIEQIHKVFFQLFQTTCLSSKFLDIDSSLIHSITKAPIGNLVDGDNVAILASLRKYSKVVLSPDYEMNLEKEYKKKIQVAEGNVVSVVAQKDKTINELKANDNNQKLKIAALEKQVGEMETEIQKQRNQGNLVQSVAKIKEPITSLANYFRIQDMQKYPQPPDYVHKNFRVGLLSCVLLTIVLILSIIALFRTPTFDTVDGKKIAELEEQVSKLKTENQDLKVQLNNKESGESSSKGLDDTPIPVTLRIDVGSYSGGNLKAGTQYKVCVMNSLSKYNGVGEWTIINADIVKGSKTDVEISIKPTGKGDVNLSYKPKDAKCSCQPRSFKIERGGMATPNPRIVIEPNVSEVIIDKEYTFSVTDFSGEGEWRVDGFSAPNDKKASKIKVKAIDKGKDKATISYTPDGDDNHKIKRTFEVKKK